jgi:hypothetical protein
MHFIIPRISHQYILRSNVLGCQYDGESGTIDTITEQICDTLQDIIK